MNNNLLQGFGSMKWTMIQMSLKKHSLYNLNWSCFKHTVPCANVKPCCIVLQLYMYLFEKLSRNQSWVNLLFSVLRDSILDAILDSLFLIRAGSRIPNRVKNRDSQRTVNLLLNGFVIDRQSKERGILITMISSAKIILFQWKYWQESLEE